MVCSSWLISVQIPKTAYIKSYCITSWGQLLAILQMNSIYFLSESLSGLDFRAVHGNYRLVDLTWRESLSQRTSSALTLPSTGDGNQSSVVLLRFLVFTSTESQNLVLGDATVASFSVIYRAFLPHLNPQQPLLVKLIFCL